MPALHKMAILLTCDASNKGWHITTEHGVMCYFAVPPEQHSSVQMEFEQYCACNTPLPSLTSVNRGSSSKERNSRVYVIRYDRSALTIYVAMVSFALQQLQSHCTQ